MEKDWHLHEIALNANCADNVHICVGVAQQVHMGQDLCAGFSLENAITDQFTPPHFSMLRLSLAKCTWVEMKHGNGLCLWTLSKHTGIVCHMLYRAQVAHQNDFKLGRIHPSCSYLIWAFTLSPLSFNRSLLIGVFFLPGWLPHCWNNLSFLVVWMSTRHASVQLLTCTHTFLRLTVRPMELFSTNASLDE